MKHRIFANILIAVGLTLGAKAQLQSFTVPSTSQRINVYLDNISTSQRWALALRVSDNNTLVISPAAVTLRNLSDGPVNWTATDFAFDKENLKLQDNEIHLSGNPNDDKSIFAKVEIPAGKTVSVIENGQMVFEGALSRKIDIVDGTIGPGSEASVPKLLMALSLPGALADAYGGDFFNADDSQNYVTTAGLQRHLITSPPTISPSSTLGPVHDAKSQMHLVVVQVVINTKGLVVGAHVTEGSGQFAENVLAAVKQAKFKPFEKNGADVEVTANISYNISTDGVIRSSLE